MPQGKRVYTYEHIPSIERIAVSFINHRDEFKQLIEEVRYFLKNLPDAQGLQPQGRRYAQAILLRFDLVLDAAEKLKVKKVEMIEHDKE